MYKKIADLAKEVNELPELIEKNYLNWRQLCEELNLEMEESRKKEVYKDFKKQ